MEQELWITAPFNKFLAEPANAVLNAVGLRAEDPAHPWANWLSIEIVVALLTIILFAFIRSRLSVERPSKLQHSFELIYEFLHAQAEEVVGHGSRRYLAFFGTIFFFVLFMNLIGIIPTLESPTMYTMVPCGLAVATFIYYNSVGLRANGAWGYIKQFLGPMLVAGAGDAADRNRKPFCTPALAHHTSLCEYVCGRAGDEHIPFAGPAFRTFSVHGAARICLCLAGIHLFITRHDLRGHCCRP